MPARLAMFVILATVFAARPTDAQDRATVGLTIAFPGSVGVIWQSTDALAIRTDFTFSQAGIGSLNTSTTSTGVGLSALFYVRKWDSLRAYLSPRFGYQHSSASLLSATNTFSGSGSFGAECVLHRHFAVFAETGVSYSHANSSATPVVAGLSIDTSSHVWGTRAGVGGILYF